MKSVKLIVGSEHQLEDRATDAELDLQEWEIVKAITYIIEDSKQTEQHRVATMAATNNLVGRILTIVDASFSDYDQRKAIKDLMQNTIWAWHNEEYSRTSNYRIN